MVLVIPTCGLRTSSVIWAFDGEGVSSEEDDDIDEDPDDEP